MVYSIDEEILNVLGKCHANQYFEHDAANKLHFSSKIDPKSVMGANYKSRTF